MAKKDKSLSERTRSRLAYGTLISSVLAITVLAVVGVLSFINFLYKFTMTDF